MIAEDIPLVSEAESTAFGHPFHELIFPIGQTHQRQLLFNVLIGVLDGIDSADDAEELLAMEGLELLFGLVLFTG